MQRTPTVLVADESWGGWWSEVKEEAVRPGDMSGTIHPSSQRPPQICASNAFHITAPRNPINLRAR